MMRIARLGLIAMLALFLWPLVYAVWLSFTPDAVLRPPVGDWSLRWYEAFFTGPRWTGGLTNSLVVGALSVGLTLVMGTGLALGLARRSLRGAGWLTASVTMPLLMPPVVLGMALLPFMRDIGLWGSWLSLALGHCLISLPVVFLVLRDALAETDPDIELAARGLGASPFAVFVHVTFPLLTPALVAGGLIAFILSINEFVVALFLTTPAMETLPTVIWPNLRYTLTPVVAAASAVSLVVTILGLAAVLLIRSITVRRRSR